MRLHCKKKKNIKLADVEQLHFSDI